MTTESGYPDVPVLKLFLPRLGFSRVLEQLGHRTVIRSRIATRADLHRLKPQGRHFVQHLVQRELFVNRIEYADRDLFALVSSALRDGCTLLRSHRRWRFALAANHVSRHKCACHAQKSTTTD